MELRINKQHVFNTQEEYKIAVVGDVHLMSSSPRSRKDDYFMNTVSEIDKIFHENDIILFLGDIFDTPILAGKLLYKFINLLKYHLKLGKKFYTIIGNHDLYAYNIDSLPKTSLGLLFIVPLIKNLKRIKIHNVIIDGIPFFPKLNKTPMNKFEFPNESILLGHYFYNFNLDPEYSLTDDMIKEMNYDYLLLGHDHKPYPEQTIGKTKLLRGGSIARDSADIFNLTRKPCYYQFIINKTGIKEYNYIEIPNCLFGKDIFIDDVFEKTKITNDYGTVTSVEEILKKFTKKSNVAKYTITDALNDLQSPDQVKNYIKNTYQINNVPFV